MGTTGVTVLPADQFVSSQCMAQINWSLCKELVGVDISVISTFWKNVGLICSWIGTLGEGIVPKFGGKNTLIFSSGVGIHVNSTEIKYDSCDFHFWDTYKDKWSTATENLATAISVKKASSLSVFLTLFSFGL